MVEEAGGGTGAGDEAVLTDRTRSIAMRRLQLAALWEPLRERSFAARVLGRGLS